MQANGCRENPEHAPEGTACHCPVLVCDQQQSVECSCLTSVCSNVLDRNLAAQSFKFLNKYRPETKAEKKERLTKEATAISNGQKKEDVSKKPYNVSFRRFRRVGLAD
jgi:hypothetical protein